MSRNKSVPIAQALVGGATSIERIVSETSIGHGRVTATLAIWEALGAVEALPEVGHYGIADESKLKALLVTS